MLQTAEILPAPLGMDLLPAGLLLDPLGDLRAVPQAAIGRTASKGLAQRLLLRLTEQRASWRGLLLPPPVAHRLGSMIVVAPEHPAGIAVAEADELGGVLDGLAVGHQAP